jgi:hypothetical protein
LSIPKATYALDEYFQGGKLTHEALDQIAAAERAGQDRKGIADIIDTFHTVLD